MRHLNRRFLLTLLGGALLLGAALGLLRLAPTAGAQGPSRDVAAITAAIEADAEPGWQREALGATPCVGGTAAGFPCSNVDLMAHMPLSSIGGSATILAASLWGWTDPQTGKEYALVGLRDGTSFVDISDAANPIYLGKLPTHTGVSLWRELKVYNNHAYIVSDGNGNHGIQIFDLTQLRNVPTPPVIFTETAHYGNVGSVHNMVINEQSGFGYAVGTASGAITCAGGLHMISLQNPTAPTFAGCFSADGYTHDAQCVTYAGPDAEHLGKEICVGSNADTITVVDMSNPLAPVMLSRTSYPGVGYTHQTWFTDDQRYMVLDDELDEVNFGHNGRTYLWDMADLNAPLLMGYHDSSVSAIDHNQYIRDGYLFQANYRAGLRVLDLSDIANGNLTEVGFFDIYPPDDAPSFNGAWNVYPFFASGNVIVSGIEQGLFVLHPNVGAPTAVTVGALGSQLPTAWRGAALAVALLAGAGAAGLAWRRRR